MTRTPAAPAPAAFLRALGIAGWGALEVRALLTPSGWRRDLEPIAARIEELPSRIAARREEGRNA